MDPQQFMRAVVTEIFTSPREGGERSRAEGPRERGQRCDPEANTAPFLEALLLSAAARYPSTSCRPRKPRSACACRPRTRTCPRDPDGSGDVTNHERS